LAPPVKLTSVERVPFCVTLKTVPGLTVPPNAVIPYRFPKLSPTNPAYGECPLTLLNNPTVVRFAE